MNLVHIYCFPLNKRQFALLLSSVVALSGFSLSAAPSPGQIFDAVRDNNEAKVKACLSAGLPVNVRNERGETPLIAAAMLAGPEVVSALLEAGADPNATNHEGATALFRAASRPELATLLLEAGADVKARSKLGNTPLIVAARQRGSAALVKRMLDAGADPDAANVYGVTALMAAAAVPDIETIRLLLDHGADVNATPVSNPNGFVFGGGRSALMWAAYRGDAQSMRFLIERGARLEVSTFVGNALTQAAWGGHVSTAKALIDAGATVESRDMVGNYTPLHWAASAERRDPAMVDLLIRHGADPNSTGGDTVDAFLGELQTPLGLAQKRGDTAIAQLLLRSGAHPLSARPSEASPLPVLTAISGSPDENDVAAAIARAIPPLQKTAADSRESYLRHISKQNCLSCHQQYLPMAAIGLARELGFAVHKPAAQEQIELSLLHPSFPRDFEAQATFHPEAGVEIGLHLLGLHYEDQPANHVTDKLVHYLVAEQNVDGRWFINMPRPPLQASDLVATAFGIFSLRSYPIPGRQEEFETRIELAANWLRQQTAETHDEHIFQILGLSWAGEDAECLTPYLAQLVVHQRPDGGWGQLAELPSDAYATGQALFALAQAGGRTLDDASVQRAAHFLLSTQAEDGTWRVVSRTFPFQPPMDSGFPYGADSWLSAAGTSWAVMGLSSTLDPSNPPAIPLPVAAIAPHSPTLPAVPEAVQPVARHDFARDIRPVLERSCLSCHGPEKPKGGFRVDNRESLVSGGNRGDAAIVPGKPEKSRLMECITDAVEDLEMPPLAKRDQYPALSPEEIASFQAWIAAGAPWPAGMQIEVRVK